jgi:hypothetical protein
VPAKRSEHVRHRLGGRRPVEVEGQLLSMGALVRFGARFAQHTTTPDPRDLVDGELLALPAPHRGPQRVDRLRGRPVGRPRRDLAPPGTVVRLGDEVDLDGVART